MNKPTVIKNSVDLAKSRLSNYKQLKTDLLCATELNKKYEQLCKDSSALAERLQKENKKLRAKKSAEPKEILAAIDALSSRAVSYGGARNANNLASVRRAKKHLINLVNKITGGGKDV